MIVKKTHLSRRTVLRGIGGTAVALPFLDAMVPALTAQAKTAAAPRLRFGAVYFPHGTMPEYWVPKTTDPGFELPELLKPLEPFRDQVTVVSGMSCPDLTTHLSASAMFLNGAPPKKTESEDVGTEVTVDQLIAGKIGADTVFPSLELGTEDMSGAIGACESGYSCIYFNALAWRTKTTPLPMELNPRVLFERMFGDTGSAAGRLSRMELRRSILDSITFGARRLQTKVGAADRRVLSDYLDNVREVERQIQRAEQQVGSNGDVPEAPAGIPESYDEHLKLMYDLAALALRADVTRVFSFMTSHEGTMRGYPQLGVLEGHHSISHHRDDPERIRQWQRIAAYHAQAFAKFVGTLHSIPDGDGNLLDQTMLLYGSGMSNANPHSKENLPNVIVGGACGRIRGNRHLAYPRLTPHGNLLVAVAQKAGLDVEKLGLSNGRVDL